MGNLIKPMVFFSIGLLAVGYASFLRLWLQEHRLRDLLEANLRMPESGKVPVTLGWISPWSFSVYWMAESIAGGAFLAGVLGPIFDLVVNRMATGSWTW